MEPDRQEKFQGLMKRVHDCRKCPRMENSARVLGPGCGPIDAPVIFVGEAPGRLGADGSHLPFHGDKSGHNFESLIEHVGISRYHVFVTNAVLCNPRDAEGNNSTPSSKEISNCAPFLREQIELINPKIVVTLGGTSLKSCSLIEPHSLTLKDSIRTSSAWFGRQIIPAYHPGQRAMIHRSFANQLSDYQFIVEASKRLGKTRRETSKGSQSFLKKSQKLSQVTKRILEKKSDGLSYFALHKLHFLSEVACLEATGQRLANSYVVRQKDGPYYVDLHVNKINLMIPNLVIDRSSGKLRISTNPQTSLYANESLSLLSEAEIRIIDQTVERYGNFSDADLKRVAYLSKPMRTMLRKEQKLGLNLYNSAVLPYHELHDNL